MLILGMRALKLVVECLQKRPSLLVIKAMLNDGDPYEAIGLPG